MLCFVRLLPQGLTPTFERGTVARYAFRPRVFLHPLGFVAFPQHETSYKCLRIVFLFRLILGTILRYLFFTVRFCKSQISGSGCEEHIILTLDNSALFNLQVERDSWPVFLIIFSYA